MSEVVELAVGQRWRHKRESWRNVKILELRTWESEKSGTVTDVYVRRNTSRRTQPMTEKTLRRSYYLSSVGDAA